MSSKSILVAGDICLDVVGIPTPPKITNRSSEDNWRQTGEIHTHHLPGGALQLTRFVRAALGNDELLEVMGPLPCRPASLSCGQEADAPMDIKTFLGLAERLSRNEIVNSLLEADVSAADGGKKGTIRLKATHGFSGPRDADPSLKILPPRPNNGDPCAVVLDDTGNRFRRSPDQWPDVIATPDASMPFVVYKLHRPLPSGTGGNPLWKQVMDHHRERCIVVVSVEDLRGRDAPISRGLSWERTALDVIWQLLHADAFRELATCRHLIVRFGMDGALYWHSETTQETEVRSAWLFYDPEGIEGTGEAAFPDKMVGYASVFTASVVAALAKAACTNSLDPQRDANNQKFSGPSPALAEGIRLGLAASRELLKTGFGQDREAPDYPGAGLFESASGLGSKFACQQVPIIPGAATADRGYWRLLESIFNGKADHLRLAAAMTATGRSPMSPKEEEAFALLKQVPVAIFAKALRAVDRREIENYRALYNLLHDYLRAPTNRPLSVAVFGPPGAGKSFGVKMVAKELAKSCGSFAIDSLTFNLSQYQSPDDLASAFHLVRDRVLAGKTPLVFFDEFDTSLGSVPLGWLRYFLAPMQDGEFIDRGSPHPIGKAIFIFAGGTCGTYEEFSEHRKTEEFKARKGPDFLSRLRGSLDIPGLDLQRDFDPYGPIALFPCDQAILLRRAGILNHMLGEKAPHMRRPDGAYQVSSPVLRALLNLPSFEHGNRSFEALLDMSHLHDASTFTPSMFPASGHTALHADSAFLSDLLATEYPFAEQDRLRIAREIHNHYLEEQTSGLNPEKPSHQEWEKLNDYYKNSNCQQADDIAAKLRSAGLWFRKKNATSSLSAGDHPMNEAVIDELARKEHDRWVSEQRRAAFIRGESFNEVLRTHPCIRKWDGDGLSEQEKEKDLNAIRGIPRYLEAAGFEIFRPDGLS